MGIKNNPYGVGVSGHDRRTESRLCGCCGAEFVWTGTRESYAWDNRCNPCARHKADSPDAELAMLRDHNERLPAAVQKARAMTRKTRQELDRGEKELREKDGQVRSALRSRDIYRQTLDAVERAHPTPASEAGCGCGRQGCGVGSLIREARRQAAGWGD